MTLRTFEDWPAKEDLAKCDVAIVKCMTANCMDSIDFGVSQLIMARECNLACKDALSTRLSGPVVASAGYLDGKLCKPSLYILCFSAINWTGCRDRCWKVLKYQGKLTRPSVLSLDTNISDFIQECSDGITQWGHLVHEIAFITGFAPKYGA